jgi:hypothetical protein
MSNNEVEATFARIQPGVHVDIKMSNGQTQHAIVSGVNLETRTVSVTWSEEGEIRGKELFLEEQLGRAVSAVGQQPCLSPCDHYRSRF